MGWFDKGLFGPPETQQDGGLLGAAKPNNWDIVNLVASGLQDANAGYRGQPGGYADDAIGQLQARGVKQGRDQLHQKISAAMKSNDINAVRQALVEADAAGVDISHITSALNFGQPKFQAVGKDLYQLPTMGDGSPTLAIAGPKEAPKTRTIQRGLNSVEQEFNGQTGQFADIPGAVGPKFSPHAEGGGDNNAVGWQLANDPTNNKQYRINVRSGEMLDLDGKAYHPGGLGKIDSGQVRSAQSVAVKRYVQEHPNASADDIAQFAADFGATGKSVGAFSTGKQGDLLRSFNVGISHLNTLDGLVGALNNGDLQAFNKLGNAYAQQTGNPAPTNFDAAKAIVGDEIIKAIVGGGGALADRENAQNQINRANSPEQLRGVIKTYKDLMGGQLQGLKKQYTDTTHRTNFDSRLTPEARSELEGSRPLPRLPATHPADIQSLLKKYGK